MAAANATVKTMLQVGILDHCRIIGDYFLLKLKKLQEKRKIIKDIRGTGLILAAQLNIESGDIVNECLQRGLLIISAGSKTLRFVPPLMITTGDVDQAISVLDGVLEGK
jgi:acetylornithine/succinyldiaminopimelate/putrescine aminotransferase